MARFPQPPAITVPLIDPPSTRKRALALPDASYYLLSALTILTLACGSSSPSSSPPTCQGVVDAFANIHVKTAACSAVIIFSINTSFPISGGYTLDQCNADLVNCSASDRAAIDAFVGCANDLPTLTATCTPAEVNAFQQDYNGCTPTVSAACSAGT